MDAAVIVVGAVAELVAWRVVAAGRRSVWVVMGLTLASMGIVAALVRPPALSPAVSPATAAAAGAGAGVLLYLATFAFVTVVGRWHTFRAHALAMYERRGALSLPATLLLAAGVVAIGEELFWRGLFQPRLSEAVGRTGGATLTWTAYIVANLASGSLPIIAGAVVGGAVWTGLAFWTRGVLASLLCHAVWTALMLVFPVVRPDARAGSSS